MKLVLDDKTAIADQEAFEALLDYSASLPTGTTPGKRWKRRIDYHDENKGWMLGEYVLPTNPEVAEEFIMIKWRTLLVVKE